MLCNIKFSKIQLTFLQKLYNIIPIRGDMAQLVERCVRNAQARGSNPLISTRLSLSGTPLRLFFSGSSFLYKHLNKDFLAIVRDLEYNKCIKFEVRHA